MPLAAVYPYGLTSSKFYSCHWCSQAERPRFPSQRCVSEAALAPLRAASLRSAPHHLQGASRKNWKQFRFEPLNRYSLILWRILYQSPIYGSVSG